MLLMHKIYVPPVPHTRSVSVNRSRSASCAYHTSSCRIMVVMCSTNLGIRLLAINASRITRAHWGESQQTSSSSCRLLWVCVCVV